MRARRPLIALLTALLGAVVVAPASADHVAEVYADSQTCVMGGQVSNIGPSLQTQHISRLTTKNGRTTGYVCHFDDVPPRAEWYTSSGYLWGPPEKGVYRITGFTCWDLQEPGRYDFTKRSQLTVTPSGRATLVCNLDPTPSV